MWRRWSTRPSASGDRSTQHTRTHEPCRGGDLCCKIVFACTPPRGRDPMAHASVRTHSVATAVSQSCPEPVQAAAALPSRSRNIILTSLTCGWRSSLGGRPAHGRGRCCTCTCRRDMPSAAQFPARRPPFATKFVNQPRSGKSPSLVKHSLWPHVPLGAA